MNLTLADAQEQVIHWIENIHPNRTPEGTLLKLFEEIGELAQNPGDIDEFADILIVLLDLAYQENINANDLVPAVMRKMEINRSRSWDVNQLGVMSHE